jgi:hypothetical protein
MPECTHAIGISLNLVTSPLRGDEITGVSVWTWSTRAKRWPQCHAGDGFVVATEPVAAAWHGCVDVVLDAHRATVDDALAIPLQPGCALVATPVSGLGTAFRLRGGSVLVVPDRIGVCGVCVYPWLVLGCDPFRITGHRLDAATAVPQPRRESAGR